MKHLKLVLAILLLLTIIAGGIFVTFGAYSTDGGSFIIYSSSDNTSEVYTDFEERNLTGAVFLEEVRDFDDHFAFLFIPKARKPPANYYFSFEIKENGTTLESAEKRYYEEVSHETPIVMRVPKNPASSYEIEALIEDETGIEVHKSKTRIGGRRGPQTQKP